MAEYADPVIDWLDQDDSMVSQRYFRQVTDLLLMMMMMMTLIVPSFLLRYIVMCAEGRQLPEGYVKSRNIQQKSQNTIHYT